MGTFKELGVKDAFVKALQENGITTPSEIQEKSIPTLLKSGKDFIGQAQTGTGKTAAFGLPLLHKVSPKSDAVQALVLCPTRELGLQIAKQLFKFTKYSEKIFVEAVYGGEKIDRQIKALKRPTQIVVATPGRLIDLLERKAIDLSNIKTVVLDEADEMLSMGFKKDIDKILRYTNNRNIWLFSATIPSEIQKIISTYMSPSAERVQVDKANIVSGNIEHQYLVCEIPQKLEILTDFLRSNKGGRGIIFCRTKAAAKTLAGQLFARKYSVDTLHGDLTQKERDKAMRAFKGGKVDVLIATDISARGIDVADLAFVIHYQLPDQLEYYTHRSGRTGRAGKKGISLAFVIPKEERRVREIEKELKITIRRVIN